MENFTPPHERNRRASERHRLARELAELLLSDPGTPENLKLGLRLGEAGRIISEKIYEIVRDTGLTLDPRCTTEQVQRARELLEYLQLMEAGLDAFLEEFRK